MRERVSQMIHLYGHFRRHSFDQKEERKMGREEGGEKKGEGRKREKSEGAKNRTVPIQGNRARFLRKFHVSGQGTFSIYPAQIE